MVPLIISTLIGLLVVSAGGVVTFSGPSRGRELISIPFVLLQPTVQLDGGAFLLNQTDIRVEISNHIADCKVDLLPALLTILVEDLEKSPVNGDISKRYLAFFFWVSADQPNI